MVSTRGIKLRFFVGERVLCYEPDPTKAKVLYDSKVLDIVIRKDQAGKKVVEYLIHFQGWNSSWDRCVGEEYVLKDTSENRQLQKDLAEKAQLQLGAYLYRKERKKHSQKPLESAAGSSEDGSSGSPARIDTDENPEMSSSSDEYSSLEDEAIEIEIIPELREILEADYYLINGKNKRIKLPAEPNVVMILESYYRHYATNQICGVNEKPNARYRLSFTNKDVKPKTEDMHENLTICREVVDGLRIYFDFALNDLLLYGVEKGPDQFVTSPALMQPPGSSEVKIEMKNELNNINSENNANNHHPNHNGLGESATNARRRTLRSSYKSESQSNGNFMIEESNGSSHPKPCSSVGSSNSDINGPMTKALSWRLLPEHVYSQQPPPPSLIYGAIHFTRLFVKLPELFTAASIPEHKMKVILRHVDSVIDMMEAETVPNLQFNFKGPDDILKKSNEAQMTSSTVSTISSLASPVDSGVQMMDSESELTSVMSSVSGCDTETVPNLEPEVLNDEEKVVNTVENSTLQECVSYNPSIGPDNDEQVKTDSTNDKPDGATFAIKEKTTISVEVKDGAARKSIVPKFTESDFVNKNVVDEKMFSRSVPNYFDRFSNEVVWSKHKLDSSCKSLSDEVFEMEHPIKSNTEADLMNISLNSYELLDYTMENIHLKPPEIENPDMHVSMSEEVNESLRVILDGKEAVPPTVTEEIAVIESPEVKPAEDQIVFRRQRKKKSKSDTPKKRVSFHEDILNSTKIDDIHINLGFITHEPDVSLSFFQRGFVRKPDVVKGRYSWAAEGDAPFYEKSTSNREIKSDIYIHQPRVSSSSSSSTGSVSSSIDEEDSTSDDNVPKREPTQKLPKSSCLKKTKHKKYIDTNIVQEETILRKKKSESNLLDTNIFGSLKNILSFSTSVPLAERGVPEGQEDFTIYSSSNDISDRRKSFGNFSFNNTETVEVAEVKPEPVSKIHLAKTNLKLTKGEGFYPNYPPNEDTPANIILCDSNVYEHKGISYSYEYDNFQKSFEQENKSKSSLMYQKILKEFNFFRRKAKEEPEKEAEEDFEMLSELSTPTKPTIMIDEVEAIEEVKEVEPKLTSTPKNGLSRYASSVKLDWSDTDTVSDMSETRNSRHLNSPKRRVNRNNHFTVQSPFKVPLSEYRSDSTSNLARSLPNLRPSSSKSSLINRFLKNVTLKKMLDLKSHGNCKRSRIYLGLQPKCYELDPKCNQGLDREIEREVMSGKHKQRIIEPVDKMMAMNLTNQIFRNKMEQLLRVFPVRSAYTTNGDSRPLLLILTNTTLYIVSSKQINIFCNHFVLPYTELNTILIGPNAQTVHFSNYDKDMQCIITTGCSKITNSLIGQLEMAMRRDVSKPKLAAVKHLSMRDMVNLRRAICKQTAVDKHEEYYYYSIVNIQDFVSEEVALTSMGPNKEGPLMFRTSDNESGRWETAYFILKAGVLYTLSSASQSVPMRVFPLINGACQGARRVFNSHRPHTFQLVIEGKTLHLAAPDEYVASEWLQELIHAASGIYNHREKSPIQSCSLLMTSDHVLTVREAFQCTISSLLPPKSRHEPIKGPQALSCATISDLVSFRLPSAEQSWCILEFSCREVHEYSGDWILYFSTNPELETFISTLEMLWQYTNDYEDSFPLTTIPETDPLSKKCVDIYKSLIETWPPNTVHIQFL